MLFALSLAMLLAALALPQAVTSLERSQAKAAARYLAGRMTLARFQAVTRASTIALRFEGPPGQVRFTIIADRNRNGVRTQDIESGIDVPLQPPLALSELFPGVSIEAAQFGVSGLVSFTPAGTATPGTAYIRGRDGSQFAVRVLGATARTRVLEYRADDGWIEAP